MDAKMKHEAMMKVLAEIADMANAASGDRLKKMKGTPYAGSESEDEEDAEKELLASGAEDLPTHAKMEAKEQVKGFHADESDDPLEDEEGEDSDASKLLKLKAKLGK